MSTPRFLCGCSFTTIVSCRYFHQCSSILLLFEQSNNATSCAWGHASPGALMHSLLLIAAHHEPSGVSLSCAFTDPIESNRSNLLHGQATASRIQTRSPTNTSRGSVGQMMFVKCSCALSVVPDTVTSLTAQSGHLLTVMQISTSIESLRTVP